MGSGNIVLRGKYQYIRKYILENDEYLGSRRFSGKDAEKRKGVLADVYLEAWMRFSMGIPPECSLVWNLADSTMEQVEVVDIESGIYLNIGEFGIELLQHVCDFEEFCYHFSTGNKLATLKSGIQCLIAVSCALMENGGKLNRDEIGVYLMVLDVAGDNGVATLDDIRNCAQRCKAEDYAHQEYYVENVDEIEKCLSRMCELKVIKMTSENSYCCTY